MASKLKMDGSGDSAAVQEALKELDGGGSSGGGDGDGGSREVTIGDPVDPAAANADADDGGGGGSPQGPSRREKRANRFQENEEARIRAEERARVLEEELTRVRAQPAPQYQPPQQQGPDPIALAGERLKRDHEDLVKTYNARLKAGDLTEKEAEEFRQRGWEIKEKSEELAAVRVLQKTGRLGQQQQPQGMTEQQFNQMTLANEFPEIMADPKLVQRAGLRFDEAVLDGEPPTMATTRKVMAEIQARFVPGKRPEPDNLLKQRLTGIGAGPGSGSGARGGRTTIEMTPELRKMAVRTYKHLPAGQAIQKWANEVGPGYMEDMRNDRR